MEVGIHVFGVERIFACVARMKSAESLSQRLLSHSCKVCAGATLPLEAVGPIDTFDRRKTSSRILSRAAAVRQRYAAVRWI